MPPGTNQLVDDAVTADIFANRSYLSFEDERSGVDSACLVSNVASCEHFHEQRPQQFRVGKPVDEIGFGTSGLRFDRDGVVRCPQFSTFDPDRSAICIDED